MQTLPAPSGDRDGYRAPQDGGERDRCSTITGKRGLPSDREDRPATKKLYQGSAGGQRFTQQEAAAAPDGAKQALEGEEHGASAAGAAPAAARGDGLCGQPAATKGPDMLLGDLQRELTGTPKGLRHSPSAQQLALGGAPEASAASQQACEERMRSAGAQQLAPREAADAPSRSEQAPEGLRHSAQQHTPGDTPAAPAGSQQAPEGPRHSASNQQPALGEAPEAPAGSLQAQLSGATAAVLLPLIETICKASCEELIQSMQRELEAVAKGKGQAIALPAIGQERQPSPSGMERGLLVAALKVKSIDSIGVKGSSNDSGEDSSDGCSEDSMETDDSSSDSSDDSSDNSSYGSGEDSMDNSSDASSDVSTEGEESTSEDSTGGKGAPGAYLSPQKQPHSLQELQCRICWKEGHGPSECPRYKQRRGS